MRATASAALSHCRKMLVTSSRKNIGRAAPARPPCYRAAGAALFVLSVGAALAGGRASRRS